MKLFRYGTAVVEADKVEGAFVDANTLREGSEFEQTEWRLIITTKTQNRYVAGIYYKEAEADEALAKCTALIGTTIGRQNDGEIPAPFKPYPE